MKTFTVTKRLYDAAIHLQACSEMFLKAPEGKEEKDLLIAALKRFEHERLFDLAHEGSAS